MTTRRDVIRSASAISISMTVLSAQSNANRANNFQQSKAPIGRPEGRKIRAAFMVGRWANLIDVAGPWETFASVVVDDEQPFELFTVAEAEEAVPSTGGFLIKPHYTITNAPVPDIIVSPAHGRSEETVSWLKRLSASASLTMSVCTGAFALAEAGLLDGKPAATHHDFWDSFEKTYPQVDLQRGPRFVDTGHIASAGGLTSGIDLALHVVERYFDRPTAEATAKYLEYKSEDWKV